MNTKRHGLIIDFNSIAAMLAHEDESTQAIFFNTFAKELNTVCGTDHAAEMQATWIRGKLTPEAKEICETLCWKEGNP